jgi:hypothetical protein
MRVIFILFLVFVSNVTAQELDNPNKLNACPEAQNFMNYDNCWGAISSGGNKYVGEWKDGKPHGQGTLTYPNGNKYVGELKDGKYHGQGTVTTKDGQKYVGELKEGSYHGQGNFTFANGDKYVGEFKNHNLEGRGKITYADGRIYVGEFDGLPNGKGKEISANGRTSKEGIFVNGNFFAKDEAQAQKLRQDAFLKAGYRSMFVCRDKVSGQGAAKQMAIELVNSIVNGPAQAYGRMMNANGYSDHCMKNDKINFQNYNAWVNANKFYVKNRSGEVGGYVVIDGMNAIGLITYGK